MRLWSLKRCIDGVAQWGNFHIWESTETLKLPFAFGKGEGWKKTRFFFLYLNIQVNTMWNFVKNELRTKTSWSLILVFSYFYVIQGKYTKEKVKLWRAIYSAQYTFPLCHFCTFCEKVHVNFFCLFSQVWKMMSTCKAALATLLQTHFPFLWFIFILEAIFN